VKVQGLCIETLLQRPSNVGFHVFATVPRIQVPVRAMRAGLTRRALPAVGTAAVDELEHVRAGTRRSCHVGVGFRMLAAPR
jgi:hypothetical protein